ncbi:hypothetical protein ACFC1R_29385 [Kitasatospora sp. NPDC056138]|uniref:hypothetical protein n=1 Tax=Kitasatospora sp. NPDC056138 TaxID=3345724 RepID=UPI0035D9837F
MSADRPSRPTRRRVLLGLFTLAATAAGTGCSASRSERSMDLGAGPSRQAVPSGGNPPSAPAAPATPPPTTITGLGPKTLAQLPAVSRQAVVATGDAADSALTSVRLWTADAAGHWTPAGGPWPGHNGRDGWTEQHHVGDLHSPIGVFTLTDAGGRLPNPGTALPYDRSDSFVIDGDGFEGEPLDGSFDYVVAIDYNRVPGRSPLDTSQPMGRSRGGGVWLHVDHGGPTHACVSLAQSDLVTLLKALDPAAHPVIVMGPRDHLAR